jgi:hypothetical protein
MKKIERKEKKEKKRKKSSNPVFSRRIKWKKIRKNGK